MASPQKEHGFTPIAHELMVAILVYPLSAYTLKVLFCILAETYGRQRKKTQISYGAIARHVLCSRRHIFDACKQLQKENVIFIQKTVNKRTANIIGINKDYQTWEKWPCGFTVDKYGNPGTPIEPSGDRVLNAQGTGKEQSIEPSGDSSIEPSRDTTKNKEYRKKPEERDIYISNKAAFKKISRILKGYEDCIKKNTRKLVDRLTENGILDEIRTWASIIQARDKQNPAGYLVKILADPKYTVADSCYEQAKKEMKNCRRY